MTETISLVEVYFRTPTFDIIEKDEKDTLEMKLSAIGGTMGLLTGFSFLSAVEVIYFLIKIVRSFNRK